MRLPSGAVPPSWRTKSPISDERTPNTTSDVEIGVAVAEDVRDQRREACGLDLEVQVRRPPRVAPAGQQHLPHRPVGGHRVGHRQHAAKAHAALRVGAQHAACAALARPVRRAARRTGRRRRPARHRPRHRRSACRRQRAHRGADEQRHARRAARQVGALFGRAASRRRGTARTPWPRWRRAAARCSCATSSIDRPSVSDSRMNSCRVSLHFWPVAVRNWMPCIHSASVSCTSRAKSCRCVTSDAQDLLQPRVGALRQPRLEGRGDGGGVDVAHGPLLQSSCSLTLSFTICHLP